MCIKSDNRMACDRHGYPYNESRFEDNSCDAIAEVVLLPLKHGNRDCVISEDWAKGYAEGIRTAQRALELHGIKRLN